MPDNMPFTAARFWQEIYIAAIHAGQTQAYALVCAQKAMNDFLKLTQGEPKNG